MTVICDNQPFLGLHVVISHFQGLHIIISYILGQMCSDLLHFDQQMVISYVLMVTYSAVDQLLRVVCCNQPLLRVIYVDQPLLQGFP